jgi:hypothetical protein
MSHPLNALASAPSVQEAVAEARAAVDRLHGHRVLRRQRPQVSAEASLRGARASAALEGVDVPLAVLRADPPADGLVQGALRVSAEVGALDGVWQRAPLQALARLHLLAARDLVAGEAIGRPRPDPVVAARLDALSTLVTMRGEIPAIVLAAVVHGELLALDTFEVAGGIVARAAQRLVLVTRGLDAKAVSAPEVGHLELADDYRSALEGYRSGAPDGVVGWVVHCAQAVELGAREGLAICEALQRG